MQVETQSCLVPVGMAQRMSVVSGGYNEATYGASTHLGVASLRREAYQAGPEWRFQGQSRGVATIQLGATTLL